MEREQIEHPEEVEKFKNALKETGGLIDLGGGTDKSPPFFIGVGNATTDETPPDKSIFFMALNYLYLHTETVKLDLMNRKLS